MIAVPLPWPILVLEELYSVRTLGNWNQFRKGYWREIKYHWPIVHCPALNQNGILSIPCVSHTFPGFYIYFCSNQWDPTFDIERFLEVITSQLSYSHVKTTKRMYPSHKNKISLVCLMCLTNSLNYFNWLVLQCSCPWLNKPTLIDFNFNLSIRTIVTSK